MSTQTKRQRLEIDAIVREILPEARIRVELEGGHKLLGYLSGHMRQHNIRTRVGDRVRVELSPYDLTKARVTFRYRD